MRLASPLGTVRQHLTRIRNLWRRHHRRLRARWRLHRLEWNAQFRPLDADEYTATTQTKRGATSHSSESLQEVLGPDEDLFREWVNCPNKNRWRYLHHFLRIYFRTWDYRAEAASTIPQTTATTNPVWSSATRSLQERFSRWQQDAVASVPAWTEQLQQASDSTKRTWSQTVTKATAVVNSPQSFEQVVQSRLRVLRESIQAFRTGYEQGIREGSISAEEESQAPESAIHHESDDPSLPNSSGSRDSPEVLPAGRENPPREGTRQ
ncbi:hypothetical protein F1559_003865 [Cyanidiococcus yangmingshanensis]|uniref:Uncharacterized protein n=1 Tax=Cyanidiococcus yangmingshanensis TaxID=2690220 RepID=A0A7J7IHT3_9RHOD|nr:hypothetical protein F1559_003865 [Cyanidiococcus yangmingshanensis]